MTHGTITNKAGQKLAGDLTSGGNYLEFKIDGTSMFNSFRSSDWEFTADAPPPPTKCGIFLYNSYGLDDDGDLSLFPNLIVHLQTGDGGWYEVGNADATTRLLSREKVEDLFARSHPPVPLTLKEQP